MDARLRSMRDCAREIVQLLDPAVEAPQARQDQLDLLARLAPLVTRLVEGLRHHAEELAATTPRRPM